MKHLAHRCRGLSHRRFEPGKPSGQPIPKTHELRGRTLRLGDDKRIMPFPRRAIGACCNFAVWLNVHPAEASFAMECADGFGIAEAKAKLFAGKGRCRCD